MTNKSSKKKSIIIIAALMAVAALSGVLIAFNQDTFNAPDTNLTAKVPDLTITEISLFDDNHFAMTTDSAFGIRITDTVLNSVSDLDFTIENVGLTDLELTTSVIKLAWDTTGNLPVKDYVYLYPSTMTDAQVISNIQLNNANHGNLALSKNLTDTAITLNNGNTRQGLAYEFLSQTAIYLSPGATMDFSYKVAFYRYTGTGTGGPQPASDFPQFNKKDLAIDIDIRGLGPNSVITGDDADADINVAALPLMASTAAIGNPGVNDPNQANKAVWGMPNLIGTQYVASTGAVTTTSLVMQRNWVQRVEFIDDDIDDDLYEVGDTYNGLPVISAKDISFMSGDKAVWAFITPTVECMQGDMPKAHLSNAVSTSKGAMFLNLYVQSTGGADGVIANQSMYGLLGDMVSLQYADVRLLRVDETIDASYFFINTLSLDEVVGLENWKTGNIGTLSAMFYSSVIEKIGGSTDFDFSMWDLHNLTNWTNMFSTYMSNADAGTYGSRNWLLGNNSTNPFNKSVVMRASKISFKGSNLAKVRSSDSLFAHQYSLPEIDMTDVVWPASGSGINVKADRMFSHLKQLATLSGLNTWNTERFSDCTQMFRSASALATRSTGTAPPLVLDFSGWDLSNITNAGVNYMFMDVQNVQFLGLENLNLSKARNLVGMFYWANWKTTINQAETTVLDLSGWDVSSGTEFQSMFYQAAYFKEINVSGWKLNTNAAIGVKLGDVRYSNNGMFYYTLSLTNLIGLKTWDTSNVSDAAFMLSLSGYNAAESYTLDVSGMDFTKCRNFTGMFAYLGNAANKATIDVRGLKLATAPSLNVNLAGMFVQGRLTEIIGLNTWDTSRVSDMRSMFARTANYGAANYSVDITGWNTSNVRNMQGMFYEALSLSNITGMVALDVSKVENMALMFASNPSITTLDLHDWNLSSATNIAGIFQNLPNLTAINMNGWQTTNGALNTGGTGSVAGFIEYNNVNASYPVYGMFTNDVNLEEIIGLEDIGSSAKLTDISWMFGNCKKLAIGNKLTTWDTSYVQRAVSTFEGTGISLAALELDISSWNLPMLADATRMFALTTTLRSPSISRTFENLAQNTTAASLSGLFNGSGVRELYVGYWDTSKVVTMGAMFYNAASLTTLEGINSWNVAKVATFEYMFTNASTNATYHLENFTITAWTPNLATNYTNMFNGFGYYTNLHLENLVSGSAKNLAGMFAYARVVSLTGLTTWVVTAVTDMSSTFAYCGSVATTGALGNLDLSTWSPNLCANFAATFSNFGYHTNLALPNAGLLKSAATDCRQMFQYAHLDSLTNADKFDMSKIRVMYSMFYFFGSTNSNMTTLDVSDYDLSAMGGDIGDYNRRPENLFTYSKMQYIDVTNWNWGTGAANIRPGHYAAAGENWTSVDAGLFTHCTDLREIIGINSWQGTRRFVWLRGAFYDCGNNPSGGMQTLDLSNWSLDNNANFEQMFQNFGNNCTITLPTSGFVMTAGKSTGNMFNNARVKEIKNLDKFTMTNVANTVGMFDNLGITNSTISTLDVSGWNLSALAANGYAMFRAASVSSIDVSNWDFGSGAATLRLNNNNLGDGMFGTCTRLENIIGLDTWQGTNRILYAGGMFYNCGNTGTGMASLDISTLDFSNCQYMGFMFQSFGKNTVLTLTSSGLVNTTTTLTSGMFADARLSTLSSLYLQQFNMSNVSDANSMFKSFCATNSGITRLDIKDWQLPALTTATEMFGSTYITYSGLTNINLANWNFGSSAAPLNLSSMFSNTSTVEVITASTWEFAGRTGTINPANMFYNATNLQEIVGIGDWGGTSQFTNTSNMFRNCGNTGTGMANLDLSNWNLINDATVTNMFYSFGKDTQLYLNGLVKPVVTNLTGMFQDARVTLLDASDWDTSNVINMTSVFEGARIRSTLDMTGWDTSKVANMTSIFYGAFQIDSAITSLDLSSWNVSKVTSLNSSFRNCSVSALDLSTWDLPLVVDVRYTFAHGTANGGKITNLDMRAAALSTRGISATNYGNMFTNKNTSLIIYVKDTSEQTYIMARSGLAIARVVVP